MEQITINLEEIKEKLIKKFEGTGWDFKLRSFIKSDDFSKILENLHKLREDGKRFTPPLKYVFRAFQECPLDKLKVVVVGQDVYPHMGVADGLAFSCSLTGKAQPSLKNILKEVNKTVYNEENVSEDVDLKRWANQGVLMLNTALTCQIDKVGSHYDIWKDFVAYVIDMLNLTNSGIIFILFGAKAQELESLIGDNHYVLKATHPASAVYTGGTWDCNDVFNKANAIIEKCNGKEYKIQW
jgi:uracil-DNA glycosylase